MDKLKRCPFCGSGAKIHRDGSIFSRQHYEAYPGQMHGFRVECEGSCHSMTCWWHTEQEAASAWNTRHTPEGMVLVPREITADSGHKAGMIGDFKEHVTLQCDAALEREQALARECADDARYMVEPSTALNKAEEQRYALAAHVGRLRAHFENAEELHPATWAVRDLKLFNEAHVKAQWQADAVSEYANNHLSGADQEHAEIYAARLRRQCPELTK